jgi:hypothetical protein
MRSLGMRGWGTSIDVRALVGELGQCPKGQHWVNQSMVDGPVGCFPDYDKTYKPRTLAEKQEANRQMAMTGMKIATLPLSQQPQSQQPPVQVIIEEQKYFGFTRNQILFLGGLAAAVVVLMKQRDLS